MAIENQTHAEHAASSTELALSALEPGARGLSHESHFRQHVELVRTGGDALDAVARYYKIGRLLAESFVVGGTVGSIASALPADMSGPIAIIGGTASAMAFVQSWRRMGAESRARNRLGEDAQERLGESYELYRVDDSVTGHPEIVMRWYGTLESQDEDGRRQPPKAANHSLGLISGLAEDAGIKSVLIERAILDEVAPHASSFASGEIKDVNWQTDKKGVFIMPEPCYRRGTNMQRPRKERGTPQNLLAFTPERLRELSHHLSGEQSQMAGLESVIDALRGCAPAHPLVRQFDSYKDYPPEVLLQKIELTSCQALERDMEEVTAAKQAEGGAILKRKQYRQGQIRADGVRWRTQGGPDGSSELIQAVGMTREQAAEVLARPDLWPHQAVTTAAALAALLFARQQLQVQSDTVEQHLLPLQSTLQSRFADTFPWTPSGKDSDIIRRTERYNIRNLHATRLGIAVVCVLLGSAAEQVLDSHMKQAYHAAIDQAESRAALSLHQPLASLNDDQKARVDAAALSRHPLLRAFQNFRDAERQGLGDVSKMLWSAPWHWDGIFGATSEPPALTRAAGGVSGYSAGSAAVANVDVGATSSQPEWVVAPAGHVSTAGYWPVGTGNTLLDNGSWIEAKSEASPWVKQTIPGIQLPTRPLPGMSRFLAVQAGVAARAALIPTLDYSWHVEGGINIPVRQGMVPVAAAFYSTASKPEHIDRLLVETDGTYQLVLSAQQTAEFRTDPWAAIQYYLAPQANQPVHAAGPNVLLGRENERADIQKLWQAARGGHKLALVGAELATADASFLRQNFSYNPAPLDQPVKVMVGDRSHGSPYGWARFTNEELQKGQAVCNTAATLIALDAPQENVAWGYFNNGDPLLMPAEAHMWDVNQQGAITDGTPPERPVPKSEGLSGHLKLPLLIGTGLTGLEAGRRAQRRLRRQLGRRKVASYTAETLKTAKLTADTALYAPAFDAVAVLARQRRGSWRADKDNGADEALAAVTKAHLHSKAARRRLQSIRRQSSDKTERAMLGRAAGVLRAVRRAGLVQPATPAGELDGVLSK